jgi:hypothetical protein
MGARGVERMKPRASWVLEYSASQGAFHIQRVEAAIEANRRRFIAHPRNTLDWIPIFVGARAACERMAKLAERNLLMEERTWTVTHLH